MLKIENVTKEYSSGVFGTKHIKAVDDVSFSIAPKERVGLVGESGCGKSTLARIVGRLLLPSSGRITFYGEDILNMKRKDVKHFRTHVQTIFQNPQQSFSPRMKLYDTIAEPLIIHKLVKNKAEETDRIREAMAQVGLTEDIFTRYPHEISGGQAQRLAIMRILMLKPKLRVEF